jgi:5-methylcytosine-specific restriction endonuclease McrA
VRNQRAYPGCTNEIIVGETQYSDEEVVGHICHIYAAADNGPRGKPDLTEEEKNSFANLILLCGHHHPKVDKQWPTYPADKPISRSTLSWSNFRTSKSRKLSRGFGKEEI